MGQVIDTLSTDILRRGTGCAARGSPDGGTWSGGDRRRRRARTHGRRLHWRFNDGSEFRSAQVATRLVQSVNAFFHDKTFH
jgi:hypothetical protein